MRKTIPFLLCPVALFASINVAANITWNERTPMPVCRGAFGYAVVDSNIYAIGGECPGTSTSTTTVQRYTPSTDSWETDTNNGGTLAPLPAPRSFGFHCGAIERKIHCIGGWESGTYRGEHFIYDVDNNIWTNGPAIPEFPIGQSSAVVDNKIYVFGGWSGNFKDLVLAYDETQGWSYKSPMPTARNHATTAVYNGKIYVFGGGNGSPPQPLGAVEVYAPSTDSWTTGLQQMPVPPSAWELSGLTSGAPVLDGIIYVFTGSYAHGYDPESDSWNAPTPLPGAAIGLASVDGSLYAIGPEHTFVSSSALQVSLTSITLDPEDATGTTTNAPGAWSTNTADPLSQVGVRVNGVFVNHGSGSGTLGEISIPLTPGINSLTLFGNGTFPANDYYGAVLFFDGMTTPPQIAVYNANGTLGRFMVQPPGATIIGSANGGPFFDVAPGTSFYLAPDGTKVEVVGFVVNSMSSSVDEISFAGIGADMTFDTTAQLILNVTLPQEACAGDFDVDGDVDGSDLGVFSQNFGRMDCPAF